MNSLDSEGSEATYRACGSRFMAVGAGRAFGEERKALDDMAGAKGDAVAATYADFDFDRLSAGAVIEAIELM